MPAAAIDTTIVATSAACTKRERRSSSSGVTPTTMDASRACGRGYARPPDVHEPRRSLGPGGPARPQALDADRRGARDLLAALHPRLRAVARHHDQGDRRGPVQAVRRARSPDDGDGPG